MSYTTITQATKDQALQDRVTAAACKEAWVGGAEFMLSAYGERLRAYPQEAVGTFIWPVSLEYEDAYEYAITAGSENPGGDETVITDANIQSSVQAHWPRDANVPPIPVVATTTAAVVPHEPPDPVST